MGQIINYTRLTTSDRLDDRFLTCQVYEPADLEQARSGVIFSQIEILNPWFPTSQIGQTVINTVIREYYRGNDSSDLVNFERAIKKVNEALAQIAQNGETEWIGKFSGIIALINKDEIHIAQTGKSQAYLYRGDKVNHVTGGLETSEPPHPLKTFTNLTSGNIQEGDKIVIGNAAIFSAFSPRELTIPVISYRPAACALEIARALKRRGAQNGNAIFIELTTKEQLANIPPEQKIDTVYIDKSGFDLLSTAKTMFAPIATLTGKGISSLAHKSQKHLIPKIKKGVDVSKNRIAESITTIGSHVANKNQSNQTGLPERRDMVTGVQREDKSPKAITKLAGFSLIDKKQRLKIKNKIRRLLISVGLHSSNKSRFLVVSIYVFTGILILTLSYSIFSRTKQLNNKNLVEKTAQITSLSGEASTALSKNDNDTALDKYNQILELAESIRGTKYESGVSEIIKKAESGVREISKISYIDPSKKYDVSGEISGVTNVDENLIFYKNPEGVFSKASSQSEFSLLVGGKLSGSPVASINIPDQGQAAMLLDDNSITIVDIKQKTAEEQEVKFNGGTKLSIFTQNLYVLDPLSNQIWKIADKNSSYASASSYIKDQSDITNAIDIAIDGSIYTLSGDCNVDKFSRGSKSGEFKVDTPGNEELKTCARISTDESIGSIYVVSKNENKARIIEIKKDGSFSSQYELNDSDSFKDISVDASKRTATVLTDKQILTYKF